MDTPSVDEYISTSSSDTRGILEAAREILLQAGLEESMKWGTPCFSFDAEPLVYLYAGKSHVNVGFLRGKQLDDPGGMLRGAGRKDSLHVEVHSEQDLDVAALQSFVRQSVELQKAQT